GHLRRRQRLALLAVQVRHRLQQLFQVVPHGRVVVLQGLLHLGGGVLEGVLEGGDHLGVRLRLGLAVGARLWARGRLGRGRVGPSFGSTTVRSTGGDRLGFWASGRRGGG